VRSIGRIIGGFLVVAILGGIASAVAALIARNHVASRGGPKDDELDLVTIYEGIDFASEAPALRRASATAWYGGGSLDLRGATLDPAGATLNLRMIFGGYRVVVPETWPVELHGTRIFGGISDVRDEDLVDPSLPTLSIQGLALFGGAAVVSVAPDLVDPTEPSDVREAEPVPA
jgi:hypothetical protein